MCGTPRAQAVAGRHWRGSCLQPASAIILPHISPPFQCCCGSHGRMTADCHCPCVPPQPPTHPLTHLAGGGEQEACTRALGQAQHVHGAQEAGLYCLDGVVSGAGGDGERSSSREGRVGGGRAWAAIAVHAQQSKPGVLILLKLCNVSACVNNVWEGRGGCSSGHSMAWGSTRHGPRHASGPAGQDAQHSAAALTF